MTDDDIDIRSAFKAEFVEQARKLAKLGATDAEIADFFGIRTRSLYRWRNKYPEFAAALEAGKEVADQRVVRSLYQRAIGYTIDTEKVFCNTKGEVTRVATVEQVQPSDTAIIFWLKNRDRENWRDKVDHEHAGKDGGEIMAKVTVEAVMRRMRQVDDEC